MQFVVPQFIDIETKIIGPITPRQFIILIVMSGLIALSYKLADFTLFLIEGIIIFLLGITIAFIKVNGQPVYYFFLSLISILRKPSIRVWQREPSLPEKELRIKQKIEPDKIKISRPPLSYSRLNQISLLIDTGGEYQGEDL